MIKEFKKIANKSIKETIEMFFKYPSGFHGDTGIQHYLYHRILSNASSKIYWEYAGNSNLQTLLFQSEVYTECTYQNKGNRPGRGRFDMAFIAPPIISNHDTIIAHGSLKPIIAFEVGRNKNVKLLGDYEAPREKVDSVPGDASKIIRDLRFGSLDTGYILEFFDRRIAMNLYRGQQIAKELSNFIGQIEPINCHIALSFLNPEGKARVWLYPPAWFKEIKIECEKLDINQIIPSIKNYRANRIPYEEFLVKCGDCGQALQETLNKKYSDKLKLLYGKKTMTVNKRPKGCLFRVGNKQDIYGECVYDISDQLIKKTVQHANKLINNGRINIPQNRDDKFISLVLNLLSAYLEHEKKEEY